MRNKNKRRGGMIASALVLLALVLLVLVLLVLTAAGVCYAAARVKRLKIKE